MKLKCRPGSVWVHTCMLAAVVLLRPAAVDAQVNFTHDVGTVGVPPSDVAAAPDEQDIFVTPVVPGIQGGAMGNTLLVDNPLAIGLQPGDNIDALHDQGLRRLGEVSGAIVVPFAFSVRPGAIGQPLTPVEAEWPFNAADLFQVQNSGGHLLLNDASEMNLDPVSVIESINGIALEPGSPFAPGQRILFSLTPGSPTLVANSWSPADILTAVVGDPGSLQVSMASTKLGLLFTDDIDGIVVYMADDVNGNGRLDDPADSGVVYFSVAAGSQGRSGSDVRQQALTNGVEGDIFFSGVTTGNVRLMDGVNFIHLDARDDIDALDVILGPDGSPFVDPAGPVAVPPTRFGDPPPGYMDSPTRPIGGVYFTMCQAEVSVEVEWKIFVTLCDPDGNRSEISTKGSKTRVKPGDADAKAVEIAAALKTLQMVDENGDPIKTGADGKALDVFQCPPAVIKDPPWPPEVGAGGNIASVVCAMVNQEILDCGWAVDQVSLCFTEFTGSTIPIPETEDKGEGEKGDLYPVPEITLPKAPDEAGNMRLTFSNSDLVDPLTAVYTTPFVAGQSPASILADLRDQINADSGDALLTGNTLVVARVAIEPDGTDGRRGPSLVEGGALENSMPVLITMTARSERLTFNLCATDLNQDGDTGPFDLAVLLAAWGPCPPEGDCPTDLNEDGETGPFDLAALLANWGTCPPSPECQVDGQCEDGDACTSDQCNPRTGECLFVPLVCDDGDPCTVNTCDPDIGCVSVPSQVGTACGDDGGTDCDNADTCDGEGNCLTNHAPDGMLCDDGDMCTAPGACVQGVCAAGPPLDCDDGDPCTEDVCDLELGCISSPGEECCGDGVCEPGEDCKSCPGDCGACSACGPRAGDCCVAGGNGTPGCNDSACCETVCRIDPFCCDAAWDGICADQAQELCGELCGPPSNCCIEHPRPGCDDPDCEAAVCAFDPFCCDSTWDGICAGEAIELCGGLCGP